MSLITSTLSALRDVVLMQERIERMEKRLDAMADDIDGLADLAHELDKRLYALERIIDFGAQQSRQRRIEE